MERVPSVFEVREDALVHIPDDVRGGGEGGKARGQVFILIGLFLLSVLDKIELQAAGHTIIV